MKPKLLPVLLTVSLAFSVAACRGGETTTDTAGVKTDFGVTAEPCPSAIDKTKGCIYLGIISDLTEGPFRALAVPVTDAQKAFWDRVNKAGGIGKYEVDVTTYIRDNKYNPQVHAQVYQDIKPKVLALAQTLGSSTTLAVIADMKSSNIVGAPASWTSAWAFEDVITESGTNYCYESMNMLDYAKEKYSATSAMVVHFPGDYGADAAAGAKIGAEKLGMTFQRVETGPGAEAQAGAIAAIIKAKPGVVILATSPTEAAAIVGGAVAQGFTGRFIGSGPTWNPALLKSPAAAALLSSYEHSGYWGAWGTNTPGHQALRNALPNVQSPNDGYTYGWVWSYPLKAALQKAVDNKDLTREGLVAAVKSLKSVDYEGMLPSGSGNYAAGADGADRATVISKPDASAPTGIKIVKDLSVGPTAKGYKMTGPCYKSL